MLLNTVRKYISIGCGMLLLVWAVLHAFVMMISIEGPEAGGLAVLTALVTVSVGLIFQASWARKLVAAILLAFAVFVPFVVLSQLSASDMGVQGYTPPSVNWIMQHFLPIEIGVVLLVWLLNPIMKKNNEEGDAQS